MIDLLALQAAIDPDGYDVLEDALCEAGWKRPFDVTLTPSDDMRNVNARAYMAFELFREWPTRVRQWPVVFRCVDLGSYGLYSTAAMRMAAIANMAQWGLINQTQMQQFIDRDLRAQAERARYQASLQAQASPTQGGEWDNDRALAAFYASSAWKK